MHLPDVIGLGPFLLPVKPLIILIAAWIGWKLAKRTWVKHYGIEKKQLDEAISGAVVLFLVIYKFSPFLFSGFDSLSVIGFIMQRPTSTSAGLALLASIAWIGIQIKRKGLPFWATADTLIGGLLWALALYNLVILDYGKTTAGWGITTGGDLLRYQPVNWYRAFFFFLLIGLRHQLFKSVDERLSGTLQFMGFGLLIISFFDYVPEYQRWIRLTPDQWLGILLIFGGFVVQWVYRHQTKKTE